jgi:hypothetical protein
MIIKVKFHSYLTSISNCLFADSRTRILSVISTLLPQLSRITAYVISASSRTDKLHGLNTNAHTTTCCSERPNIRAARISAELLCGPRNRLRCSQGIPILARTNRLNHSTQAPTRGHRRSDGASAMAKYQTGAARSLKLDSPSS